MTILAQVCDFLEAFAPSHLAEEWDNVGLLAGDPQQRIERLMTCLTITANCVDEAIEEGVEAIVSHHPLPFRPLKRLTTAHTPGRLLWRLASAGIAVYSPHTAFDSAAAGINQQLAEGLELICIAPLVAGPQDPASGAGRCGELDSPMRLHDLAGRLRSFLSLDGLHVVGDATHSVQRLAVACGAGGDFLEAAARQRCDALITGETNFHTCLEAEALGMALLLPGHYASERFAVENLAQRLAVEFSELSVWASRRERDPLRWLQDGGSNV